MLKLNAKLYRPDDEALAEGERNVRTRAAAAAGPSVVTSITTEMDKRKAEEEAPKAPDRKRACRSVEAQLATSTPAPSKMAYTSLETSSSMK